MKKNKAFAVLLTVMMVVYGIAGIWQPVQGQAATVQTLPDGTGKKVLFDNAHGQTAGAADWVIDGGFSDFADGLRAAGFTVDELDRSIPYTFGEQAITLDKLQPYDVFVIPEADIPFKQSEQAAMLQYVQGGGSIFFIADHYNSDRNKNRWDSSEIMNGYRRGAWDNPAKGMSAEEAASPAMQGVASSDWLAQNFGARFRYNALGDVANVTDIVAPDQSFGITAGVSSVALHAGSTLAIIDPDKAKGLVYVPTDVPAWSNAVDSGVYDGGGRAEGPFAAIAKVGAGKAAFIGDSSPVEDATPKYLREDNGAAKTTYDGFNGEANDAVFLVHTVEWLANHESYTSLSQVSGLQLDAPTALLASEEPAASTEPQPEPWAAPDAGYKWYDPTTFKPGSYGSTQQPTAQPVYHFVHQSVLPNAETFQIRVTADQLLPGQTLSALKAGIYLSGGTQVAKFQNDDGTWPASEGYSSEFSMTADAAGHAHKDLTVQIKSGTSGAANLRLKADGSNALTEAVTIGDVPSEPLPEDHPPVPDQISIADARGAADGTQVTVRGVITSEPGVFGGQGFYLQDDTAGIYVYQTASGYHAGDELVITATKTAYNTELELSNPVAMNVAGTAPIPDPIVTAALSEDNQGQRVQLRDVTIHDYITAAPSGSFEFDATDSSGQSTHVRVDGRTGIDYAAFTAAYPAGTAVDVTGISSIFKGTYQLKPLSMSDVAPAAAADKTAPVTGLRLVFAAQDNAGGSGIAKTEYRVNGGAWTDASAPMTVPGEGRYVVEYRSTDNAGNVEETREAEIVVDTSGPSIELTSPAVVNQADPQVSVAVTDELSGVASVSYALDGKAIDSPDQLTALDFPVGDHTLTVTATNQAGQQTTESFTLTAQIDWDHLPALMAAGAKHDWFNKPGLAISLGLKAGVIAKMEDGKARTVLIGNLEQEITREKGKGIQDDFAQLLLDDLQAIGG